MTKIGEEFASIAHSIVNRYDGGFGSNKMHVGYTIYTSDNSICGDENRIANLEKLVEMGYLRKFVTAPFMNNHGKIVRFEIRNVCFGLTAKGWEVAPKYLAAYEKMCKKDIEDLKARNAK